MSARRLLVSLSAFAVIASISINAAALAAEAKIAFVSDRNGQPSLIYLMTANGAVAGPIGTLPGYHQNPRFSPDNRQIAFTYSAPGASNDQVYVMDSGGSYPHALTIGPNSNDFVQFTQTGQIVYSHELHPGSVTPPFTELFIMDADGSHQSPFAFNAITNDIQGGSIAGNGRIAFLRKKNADDQSQQIFVAAADGSGLQQITSTLDTLFSPVWNPDGTRLVYVNSGISPPFGSNAVPHHERDGIYIMNADGSGTRRIVKIDFGQDLGAAQNLIGIGPSRKTVNLCGAPSLSGDGATIAYALDVGDNCQVYIVDQDGSHLARLTGPPSANKTPSFSH